MSTTPLSQSTIVSLAARAFAFIGLGFSLNVLFRPGPALEWFEVSVPKDPETKNLVELLMMIYGIRHFLLSIVLHLSLSFKEQKSAAFGLLAQALIGIFDGFLSLKYVGHGEWNHFSYPAPIILVAFALLGFFDGIGLNSKKTENGKVKKA